MTLQGKCTGLRLSHKENKAVADLTISGGIAAIVALLSFSVNFSGTINRWTSELIGVNLVFWIINFLLLWLAILLALAFRQWRSEASRRRELEVVLSSISPDALIVVSPSRVVEMCNESVERIFGFSPQEVIGNPTDMLYFDRRTNRSQRGEIHDALEHEGFHVGLATGRRRDGSTVPLEIITGELSGGNGAILLLRDISERVRAEERRRALERKVQRRQKLESLGVLAGGIAHDFNNLLMGILGNADLILAELSEESTPRRRTQNIKTTSLRAADLCQQLLSYSGQGDFIKQAVNLTDMVKEMDDLLALSMRKHVTMDYQLDPDLPPIDADPSQIQQVIMNFMTNAADAAGGSPETITVTTGTRYCSAEDLYEDHVEEERSPGEYVFLSVQDNGCGMSSDTLARIFDPFFTTKLTGRGLGLAAVLGIVRGHGGALKVTSEENKGSTFTVLFPIGKQLPADREEPTEATNGMLTGTVLLADDEAVVLEVARELLEHLGFNVLTAEDGTDAVEVLRAEPKTIDIALLDMTMPKLSGQEAMVLMREIRPGLPIVLASGYSRDTAICADATNRPDAFIQKPYELDSLRQTMARIISLQARQTDEG